ncbi:hypothetical protein Poli38472_002501 [Pythium oligandrum]|uniref:Glycosyltransferase 2-like domain-containing protein n=1 Tax=Pythium oligandrum TaxID=41045 RepID=A0A8K1CIY0_PYTOL|nr:hypothetical protein Poli38472_002501 [Pythium oligandrum]|eukprot:TMW63560.1 hypothetical protein Poli38472_002501 [Pythium oligandrum]
MDATSWVEVVSDAYDAALGHRQRGEYWQAREYFEVILQMKANVSSDGYERERIERLQTWTHYHFADLLLRNPQDSGQYDMRKAREHYQAALDGDKELHVFGLVEIFHCYNSMGTLSIDLGEFVKAERYLRTVIDVDPTAVEPLGNLAMLFNHQGRLDEALYFNTKAINLRPRDFRLLHNMGVTYELLNQEDRAREYWERALSIKPDSVETLISLSHLFGERGDTERAKSLIARAEAIVIESSTLDRAKLYSIQIRAAMLHLKMIYASVEDLKRSRAQYEQSLQAIALETLPVLPPDPLISVGSGCFGYNAIYQGYNDLAVRARLADIYRRSLPKLSFVANHVTQWRNYQHVFLDRDSNHSKGTNIVYHRRRIRVGFHSAFMRHHSVGLLMSRVIERLDRDRFEVFVITYTNSVTDELTRRVLSTIEPGHHVSIPHRNFEDAQLLIAALQLDVIIFTEIGMDPATYFLAFSKLALRSSSFWGHGTTSGIDTIDYFVSSTLFRHSTNKEDRSQTRYSECLFEMESLSTSFPRPPPPGIDSLTRKSLGLPSTSVLPLMILVPQTLYKLHPDFDSIVQRTLTAVPTSFLVFPIGNKPTLVSQLTKRWRHRLSDDVYRRIFFVRPLRSREFLALCAMSDLVLDPFPVGGGRSSFEIFSVGTPILGLRSRTTILQLTLGMYRVMEMEGCCMFDDEDSLVDRGVGLLRNSTARQALRREIMAKSSRLYDNDAVVTEWGRFFAEILANPPPKSRTSAEFSTGQTRLLDECSVRGAHPSHQVLYEVEVRSPLRVAKGRRQVKTLVLRGGDEPFMTAQQFANSFDPPLDELQTAFLGKTLWNMHHRRQSPVVKSFKMSEPGVSHVLIEIREGDDVYQVIPWLVKSQLGPSYHEAAERLIQRATETATSHMPHIQTDEWIQARSFEPALSPQRADSPQRDCIALVITTCKRLAMFRRAIESLARVLGIQRDSDWSRWFCQMLVVDDNSSAQARIAMQSLLPTFMFTFKMKEERGHAKSLNMALQRLQARFLFYVEDDWEFRGSNADFLRNTVTILRKTELVQVLINTQSSGWSRYLRDETSDTNIQYFRHEFAVLDPGHRFSYWPGFSLNPGVWDIAKLQHVLESQAFDEASDIFERVFSLRVWRAGLQTGYLAEQHCVHIGAEPGTNASAYVLNGLPRRFDIQT